MDTISAPPTPPPNNLLLGPTPSSATDDRVLSRNDEHRNHHHHRHDHQNDPRHHHRTSSTQLDVVYAVDAHIVRPDPTSSPSSPLSPLVTTNNNNITDTAATTTTTTTFTLAKKEKKVKKVKTRSKSVQTKLSYFGDYAHGRPVLLRDDDPEIYMGKPVCALLMLGMVVDVALASVSYFLSWRLREPMLMGESNQEFFSRVYPAALITGVFVTYFVSLPVLGWVVSGYPEASRHDKFFLFAQLMYTIFFGIPAILVEAMWIGPMRKDQLQYYQPFQIQLSQVCLPLHCLTSGASLWYCYLVFCSRKLNTAVERRRALKIEQMRGVSGKRTFAVNRIAIRIVAEIEESQQSEEMFTLDKMGVGKFEASGAHQQQLFMEAMTEGNRRKAFDAVQQLQKIENDQHEHPDPSQQANDKEKNHHRHDHSAHGQNVVVTRQKLYAEKSASTIVVSPLPPLESHQTDEKGTQAITINGRKFFAVSSAKGGAVAAEEEDDVNGWGVPYTNPPPPPASPPPRISTTESTTTVDVPPSAIRNDKKDEDDENTAAAEDHRRRNQRTRIVGFANNNDDDDDEEFPSSRVARNVIDDDDPFVKRH